MLRIGNLSKKNQKTGIHNTQGCPGNSKYSVIRKRIRQTKEYKKTGWKKHRNKRYLLLLDLLETI